MLSGEIALKNNHYYHYYYILKNAGIGDGFMQDNACLLACLLNVDHTIFLYERAMCSLGKLHLK